MTKERCEGTPRHSWKVWWTRRLKKIGGPNDGKFMPYEWLTCRNCQAIKGRWKR